MLNRVTGIQFMRHTDENYSPVIVKELYEIPTSEHLKHLTVITFQGINLLHEWEIWQPFDFATGDLKPSMHGL
jgi:hypothetical protein